MNTIDDKTFGMATQAEVWLKALSPIALPIDLSESYPDGPIFRGSNEVKALEFLQLCAAYESHQHMDDHEMEGVKLTIEFELETMRSEQLELAFTLSHPEQQGSISYSLSVIKNQNSELLVFGDKEFLNLI